MPTTTAPPEPIAFCVWHRPHTRGAHWRKVATVTSRREAVSLVNGGGNWWLAELRDARLLNELKEHKR